MGTWLSFPRQTFLFFGNCDEKKRCLPRKEDENEEQPLLSRDYGEGPKTTQRVLDDAMRSAVMSLKFKCARELRAKEATSPLLSKKELERLADTAERFFESRTIPYATKANAIDPVVLTDAVDPCCLVAVAGHLAIAVFVTHMHSSFIGHRTNFTAFKDFTDRNIIISVPFARCARLGNVHNVALVEIAGWYPPDYDVTKIHRTWPILHRKLVEEKRRLVRALLDVGADVNAQDGLSFAAASRLAGHEIVLEELLRDPDAVNANGPFFREAMQNFFGSAAYSDEAELANLFAIALVGGKKSTTAEC